MKTKAYLIAILFVAGFVFASCQKDNSLVPDSETSAITKNADNNTYDRVHNWEADPISNYPDPFRDKTTIEFSLDQPAHISLVVTGANFGGIKYLMSGFYRPGTYKCIFDATDLPSGEYFAHLKIENRVFMERMTKREIQEKDDRLAN